LDRQIEANFGSNGQIQMLEGAEGSFCLGGSAELSNVDCGTLANSLIHQESLSVAIVAKATSYQSITLVVDSIRQLII
jgi:hypothetical protein